MNRNIPIKKWEHSCLIIGMFRSFTNEPPPQKFWKKVPRMKSGELFFFLKIRKFPGFFPRIYVFYINSAFLSSNKVIWMVFSTYTSYTSILDLNYWIKFSFYHYLLKKIDQTLFYVTQFLIYIHNILYNTYQKIIN